LRTLAGRRQIGLAAKCLSSILKYYDRPVHVVVHDDGSLSPRDVAHFQTRIPKSSFVLRAGADPIVDDFLAKYPACRKFRANSAYALKLFDVQVLEEGPELSFVDSDVVFLRPVSGLFRLPAGGSSGGVFMKNPTQAYSITFLQLLRNRGLKLADRLNSGLFHFRRSDFDWDLVEWFLSHEEYGIHPYWKEQTVWSILAAATNSAFWDEKQVLVVTRKSQLKERVAVAHFVSTYRGLLQYARVDGRENDEYVVVPTFTFGKCTRLLYAVDHTKRILPAARRRLFSFRMPPVIRRIIGRAGTRKDEGQQQPREL